MFFLRVWGGFWRSRCSVRKKSNKHTSTHTCTRHKRTDESESDRSDGKPVVRHHVRKGTGRGVGVGGWVATHHYVNSSQTQVSRFSGSTRSFRRSSSLHELKHKPVLDTCTARTFKASLLPLKSQKSQKQPSGFSSRPAENLVFERKTSQKWAQNFVFDKPVFL